MPASPWDMSSWYNWYWWLPSDKAVDEEDIPKDESPIEKENIDSIEEEIFPKEEVTQEAAPKEKPKRKKRTYTKKVKTKTQDAIELVLRPTILEELEKEAMISDSTINQVIQVILESHIDAKGAENIQTEVWTCSYCDPEREFRDYFDFSEHFFSTHMQPGLQKIENFKKEH